LSREPETHKGSTQKELIRRVRDQFFFVAVALLHSFLIVNGQISIPITFPTLSF